MLSAGKQKASCSISRCYCGSGGFSDPMLISPSRGRGCWRYGEAKVGRNDAIDSLFSDIAVEFIQFFQCERIKEENVMKSPDRL